MTSPCGWYADPRVLQTASLRYHRLVLLQSLLSASHETPHYGQTVEYFANVWKVCLADSCSCLVLSWAFEREVGGTLGDRR